MGVERAMRDGGRTLAHLIGLLALAGVACGEPPAPSC